MKKRRMHRLSGNNSAESLLFIIGKSKAKKIVTEDIEKERRRHREKYHRLNYKDKYKPSPERKALYISNHKNKFPEKYKAKNVTQSISKEKGEELHHWSYNEEHYKDVIPLTIEEHNLLHRFLEYDKETFYYRDLEGNLLDTKEKHLELYYNIHY